MRQRNIKIKVPAVSPEMVFVPNRVYSVKSKLAKELVKGKIAEYTKEKAYSAPLKPIAIHKAAIIKEPKIEIHPIAERNV